jgi:RNA polymerase sigma-70 factor (ECF subfamily)
MALRADDVDLGRDRDLVCRFQNGDPEAFDDLYRRYFDRLHRYCLRHTGDSHEAEEVAQEAFVKALRSMHSLEGERRFYPWMTVIAKRITIDRHRKYSRVELTDEPDLGSVEPDVEHLFAEVDADHVRRALENLGPRHREVLLLREAEGMSYAAIAEHLDVPMTTVEALIHRARKALRREYAAVGGERRGLLGVPLLGWLGSKAHDLRARLGDHWIEVGAVAAPLAVGAATAALVLAPGTGPAEQVEAATAATTLTRSPDAPTNPEPSDPVVLETPSYPSSTAASIGSAAEAPIPAAPTIDAGPVDVFTGPEGTDTARERAERMPLSGSLGPATGGADDEVASEDIAEFFSDALGLVSGEPGGSEDPAGSGAPDPAALLAPFFGENP